MIESFTTARAYGVEDAVLASLKETFPGIDWEKQGAYFFQRVIEHGRRRSEEVREVAETVREIGLDAMVGARHRRTPGLGRRPRRRRPVRRERHASDSPAAPTGAPRPTASSPPSTTQEARQWPRSMQFQKTPGWLDWYAGPSKPRFKAAGRRGGRALPCVRPRRRIPLCGRAQIHALRCLESSSSLRCAIISASRAT